MLNLKDKSHSCAFCPGDPEGALQNSSIVRILSYLLSYVMLFLCVAGLLTQRDSWVVKLK